MGILTKNSSEKSNAPHMPGVPPLGLNNDTCIMISKWFSMNFQIRCDVLSMFQNAFQMFCNDFEMVFNEYFVSLKCIVKVPKRVANVFKMHYQRLKMH